MQTPSPRYRWRCIWCTWDWACTCWALGRTPLIISHCLGKSRYKCSEEMEGFSVLRKRKDSHPLASLSHHMIWLTYESHDIRVTVWIFNSVLKGRSKYNETLREKLEKAKEGRSRNLSFIHLRCIDAQMFPRSLPFPDSNPDSWAEIAFLFEAHNYWPGDTMDKP